MNCDSRCSWKGEYQGLLGVLETRLAEQAQLSALPHAYPGEGTCVLKSFDRGITYGPRGSWNADYSTSSLRRIRAGSMGVKRQGRGNAEKSIGKMHGNFSVTFSDAVSGVYPREGLRNSAP